MPRHLLQGSAQRSCLEVSFRDLASRALIKNLYRDLIKRCCPGGLAKRPLLEICAEILVSYINLAKRTVLESLYRGFYKRDLGDLLRPCPKAPYRDLERDLL